MPSTIREKMDAIRDDQLRGFDALERDSKANLAMARGVQQSLTAQTEVLARLAEAVRQNTEHHAARADRHEAWADRHEERMDLLDAKMEMHRLALVQLLDRINGREGR